MTAAGHTVYHYGHERSKVACTEHISVTDDAAMAAYSDWRNKSYNGNINDECNKRFTARAISEITKRFRRRDFILCWYGTGHQKVAKAFPESIVVEPSIGTFRSFSDFRIFESYALMHHTYGKENVKPRWYDAVIPGFLDPEEYIYSADKEDWFLYLGRIEPLKGIQLALDLVRRTGRHLKVAGQGSLKTVPPNVEMVGYADFAMKTDLFARARALIVPSRYCEPFGYTAIEAAMSGTPVICPDWGGFTETVVHGVTGYRCRNMDQFDWAVQNIDKIRPETCRDWAMSNYTTERARVRYEEYFRQLRGVFFGYDFNGSDPERKEITGPARTAPVPRCFVDEVTVQPTEKPKLPSTTLLIPTYNRDELLDLGLRSIRAHEFPGELEIIVLDDGQDDTSTKTASIAKKWGAKHVRTRSNGNTGWRIPGFAFNIGAKLAKGEVLVLSCPEILHQGPCLKELAEQVALTPDAMATPRGRSDTTGAVLNAVKAGQKLAADYDGLIELNTKLPFLLAMRKDIFIEIGGYDEDFVGRCYDDNDFVDRLVAKGMVYKFTKSPIIHLYHQRPGYSIPNNRERVALNKRLWQERKGVVQRNVGREWGVLKTSAIEPIYRLDSGGRFVSQYDSVLELGCGKGKFTELIRGPACVAVDICQKALDCAREQVRDNPLVRFQRMDIRDIEKRFEQKSFDCVVGTDVIEHFEFSEALRILTAAEKIARKSVLWFIPTGEHPQTDDPWGYGNEEFNTHRSTWYPSNMEQLGYTIWHYPDWHSKNRGAMWCLKLVSSEILMSEEVLK
jgi:glycosyltransferase involved in cell wall biosynthesis